MVKKVKAPKTYNPGKGRPKEHLAYLNQNEMNYLRMLNGGNMERGPRGLPSFAEESVAGPGGSKGGGGKSGGGSGASSGAGGQGNTTSGSQSTTGTKPAGFDRSQTMMTDANGVSYDYNGNVIKSATDPNKKSNSAASPNFPSSVNLDRQIQSQTQIKDAIQAVRNTPAIKSSAPAGGIKSINVGPMGTPVSIGGSPRVSPPASKPPEAKIGMSVPRGFYDGITTERENALREAQKQSERVSSGLFGRSVNDPRDVVSSPSRADVSEKFTPAEKQAAWDSINPVKIAGRLSDAAVSAYNNPESVVQGLSQGIGAFGDYLKNSYDTIGAGALSSDPFEREAAVKASTDLALNFGIMGGVASIAAPRPANSLGSLIVGRSTADKAIKKQFDVYDSAIARGATPEQAFEESLKSAPSYAGGVVDIVADVPKSPNKPIGYAQAVEIEEPFSLKSSGFIGDAVESIFGKGPLKGISRYDEVFEKGPLAASYPEIGNMPVYKDPDYPTYNPKTGGTLGLYSRSNAMPQPGFSQTATPAERFNAIRYGSTAIQSPMKRDIIDRYIGAPDNFRKTAAHEGTHRVADIDKNLGVSTPIPQGTNDLYQRDLISRAISQSSIPQMTEAEIDRLAWDRYINNPGEFIARQSEEGLDRTVKQMRDYKTRFGNMTLDELRAMMRYGISEP